MSYASEAHEFYKAENAAASQLMKDVGEFLVKDSGKREEYESGMRRDVEEGKIDFTLALDGPLFTRYAAHMTKGAAKYGRRNWQLASSQEEYERFKRSALRHMIQWLAGDRDEDHAAAIWFNVNAAEYVLGRIQEAVHGPGTMIEARQ
jgi:hypothetical protein